MDFMKWFSGKRADTVSASWGFAEATFFFLVPDVWITLLATTGFKKGLRACFLALAGALAGGLLIYLLGVYYREPILIFYDYLPAIGLEMQERVALELAEKGAPAVFAGPASGTPYKIYAVQAAESGLGLTPFLAISVPARLFRFLAALLGGQALAFLLRKKGFKHQIMVAVVLWTVGYGFYFARMPN